MCAASGTGIAGLGPGIRPLEFGNEPGDRVKGSPDYVQSSARSGGLTRAAVFLGSRASSPQTVLVASLSRACRGLEARAPRKPMAHRVGVRMRIVRNQEGSLNH